MARRRGGRLLHARGCSFTGQVEVWGPLAGRVLDGPGRYPATIRISRGTPTPEGWPDVLGLAIRTRGRAGSFDLLLSTAGRMPLLRHLPMPRRDFAGPYSSVVSYRLGRRRLYLAALPEHPAGRTLDAVVAVATRGGVRLELAAASLTGPWCPFGRITFGQPLPEAVDAALAFDPAGGPSTELRPAGLMRRIRTATYAFSQRARGAPADQAGLP
jgi:hypothetical protein